MILNYWLTQNQFIYIYTGSNKIQAIKIFTFYVYIKRTLVLIWDFKILVICCD